MQLNGWDRAMKVTADGKGSSATLARSLRDQRDEEQLPR
jgi:hypothetical protein